MLNNNIFPSQIAFFFPLYYAKKSVCSLVFTFITLGIIYAGVRNGIERVSKFMIQYLCPIFAAIILISSVANAFGWISM